MCGSKNVGMSNSYSQQMLFQNLSHEMRESKKKTCVLCQS